MLSLLVVVVALVIILAGMLWTPIDFDVAARRDPAFRLRMRVSWLFGLVTTDIEPGAKERPRSDDGSRKASGSDGDSFSKFRRVLRSRGFLPGVARLARRLLTSIEIRRAELWARAGFDDPADTGRFLGIFFPVTHFLGSSSRYAVYLEPDFHEAVFRFDARTVLRIVPARVLGPALAFALTPATWRAVFAATRG